MLLEILYLSLIRDPLHGLVAAEQSHAFGTGGANIIEEGRNIAVLQLFRSFQKHRAIRL